METLGRGKTWAVAGLLILIATVPYLGLLSGQFLFDDYLVILKNPELWKVKSWSDAFGFVLKPSKPVTNFFIASGQLLGTGVSGHRFLSLVVHATTVTALWFFLRQRVGTLVALAATLCFSLSPIHTETLGIALFRMEAQGAAFTVLAWLAMDRLALSPSPLCQRIGYCLIFMLFGLAMGSKETFGFFFPFSLWLLSPVQAKVFRRFLILATIFWSGLLLYWLQQDSLSEYPYTDVIGRRLLSLSDQIRLGARALLEFSGKIFSAANLTTIRLNDRAGWGSHFSDGLLIGIWISPLVTLLFWRQISPGLRPWLGITLSGLYLYLLIPNTNIGSEHYAYFPSLAVWILFWMGLGRHVRPRLLLPLALALSLGLGNETFRRTQQMHSRFEFFLVDTERFPESAIGWNNVAVSILESGHPERANMARPFVERAVALAPNYPNIQLTRFLLAYEEKDLNAALRVLKEMEPLFVGNPKLLRQYQDYYRMMKNG